MVAFKLCIRLGVSPTGLEGVIKVAKVRCKVAVRRVGRGEAIALSCVGLCSFVPRLSLS